MSVFEPAESGQPTDDDQPIDYLKEKFQEYQVIDQDQNKENQVNDNQNEENSTWSLP